MGARALSGVLASLFLAIFVALSGCGERPKMLSISSGGTGGVYYPLAGGFANILTKQMPGYQVASEVTGGSVDNLKLVGSRRSDIGLSMVDAAWDAYKGRDRFDGDAQPIRTLAVLYPNRMHAVTVESRGIDDITNLAGRRISVGSPGSATEVMSLRVLEAYGLIESVERARLSVAESVNAIKDGKIDAFFWAGGLPTAAITDLAATPGVNLRLLDHAAAVESMNTKYGPLYSTGVISKSVYSGLKSDVRNANVWNILFANAQMEDAIAFEVVKALFEQRDGLIAVHREAEQIRLENQSAKFSPIPFHPGALRYYRSKGIAVE